MNLLGGIYSKFFDRNKANFYICSFFHQSKEKKIMFTININHNSKELFETFNSIGNNQKEAKKTCYLSFLKNTKLPKPKGLTSESNEILILK